PPNNPPAETQGAEDLLHPVIFDSFLEKLELGGALRVRGELRDPRGPVTGLGTSTLGTGRARVHVLAKVDPFLSGYFEFQEVVASLGNRSRTQVHQAYLRADRLLGDSTLQAGRFELFKGEGRLVAPDDWLLTPNTFDGVSFEGDFFRGLLDLSAWVTQAPAGQGGFSNSTDFQGIYGAWKPTRELGVDTYVLRQNDGNLQLDMFTTGLRLYGETFDSIRWGLEGAVQTGTRGRRQGSGYALIGQASVPLEGGHHVGLEYAFASGDDPARDNKSETFVAPYPDAHRFYGLADIVSFSNLNDIALRYWLVWNERWTMHLDLHNFSRDKITDRIYTGPGGAGIRGTGSHSIGTEVDAWLTGRISANYSFDFGGAYFIPGDGIRLNDNQIWLFAQLEIRF
ncbi:MAG: alginate export family protein, partial [Planctomycetota bacterium]